MRLERKPSSPDQGEYKSPYFSYELQDLTGVKALVDQTLYGMESAGMQLSPSTPGLLNEVNLSRWESSRPLILSTSFKVPDSYARDFFVFTSNPFSRFPMTDRVRRGDKMKKLIKQHLSDSRDLDFEYNLIRRVSGSTILGEVANLEGPRVQFPFTAETEGQFKKQLGDFFNITFIYGTMLYEAIGVNEPHSTAVISPSTFVADEYKRLDPIVAARLAEEDPTLLQQLQVRAFLGEDPKQAVQKILLEKNAQNNPYRARGENVVDFKKPRE